MLNKNMKKRTDGKLAMFQFKNNHNNNDDK